MKISALIADYEHRNIWTSNQIQVTIPSNIRCTCEKKTLQCSLTLQQKTKKILIFKHSNTNTEKHKIVFSNTRRVLPKTKKNFKFFGDTKK